MPSRSSFLKSPGSDLLGLRNNQTNYMGQIFIFIRRSNCLISLVLCCFFFLIFGVFFVLYLGFMVSHSQVLPKGQGQETQVGILLAFVR